MMIDGKRRSFNVPTDQVKKKLLELQLAVEQDKPLPPPRDVFVKAYAEAWLQDAAERLRPKSWNANDTNIRCYIVPILGGVRLADVRANHVKKLHREMRDRGLSAKTVRNAHSTLNVILKQAEAEELVEKNYAALVSPPAATRSKINPWTREEALRFLEEVRGDEHEALYITKLGLGLRRGELLGLKWAAVDLDARTLTIASQLQRITRRRKTNVNRETGLLDLPPKTDASIATLDLPEFVAEALLAQRDVQKLRHHYADDGYVFTSTTGTALEPDNITHRFPAFLKERGLRRLRLHDLRHTTASLLLAKGVPLWMVSKILRHSGMSITNDTYGHLLKETSREAADLMSGILSGAALAR
jgi:integrase